MLTELIMGKNGLESVSGNEIGDKSLKSTPLGKRMGFPRGCGLNWPESFDKNSAQLDCLNLYPSIFLNEMEISGHVKTA
jgi:hypothetical protein